MSSKWLNSDFDLPKPNYEKPEQSCIDIEEAVLNAALDIERLNSEQRKVENVIIENISDHRRGESLIERAFFIDGQVKVVNLPCTIP